MVTSIARLWVFPLYLLLLLTVVISQNQRHDGDIYKIVPSLKKEGQLKVWIIVVNIDEKHGINDNLTFPVQKNVFLNRFFGNTNSVHSSYQDCSGKKLGLTYATLKDTDTRCPLVYPNVDTPEMATSTKPGRFMDFLAFNIESMSIECDHDIKLFILQNEIDIPEGELGATFRPLKYGKKVMYVRDDAWDNISVAVHEIGHAIGQPDSFSMSPRIRYADYTDQMGNAIPKDGKMCFNAGRFHSLDWFNDNLKEVNLLETSYYGYMVSTNTMSTSIATGNAMEHDFILRMIINDVPDGTKWYAMFSRAEGVTESQPVHDNSITIVQMTQTYQNSFFLGTATIAKPFKGTLDGASVIVELCDTDRGPPFETALVAAYIEGREDSGCNKFPSTLPTPSPTFAPTSAGPTASPLPSSIPSDVPSESPTFDDVEELHYNVTYLPRICEDSGSFMYFPYNNKKRSCTWVISNSAQISNKCLKPGVKSHCPNSCDVCHEEYRCGDSTKKFFVNGIKRSCNWVKSDESKITKRCNKPNVASTCRETCKFCSNDCSDNDSFKFTIWNGKQKGCTWLTQDPARAEKRKNKWCPEIGQQCETTCGLCSADTS